VRAPARVKAVLRKKAAARKAGASSRPKLKSRVTVHTAYRNPNTRTANAAKHASATPIAQERRPDVNALLENVVFSEFISKNIGKKAINIAKMLPEYPTDEKLAAALGIKINEVRRILNMLDSYGIARYDANKDSKGWLTFVWHIDADKLEELHNSITNDKHDDDSHKMPENCNDFFYCAKCYEDQKIILPFDAAFEAGFKCEGCGKALKQMGKEEVQAIFAQENAVSIA
jgi:transcription factor E